MVQDPGTTWLDASGSGSLRRLRSRSGLGLQSSQSLTARGSTSEFTHLASDKLRSLLAHQVLILWLLHGIAHSMALPFLRASE